MYSYRQVLTFLRGDLCRRGARAEMRKLLAAKKQIDNGEGVDGESVLNTLREKYNYDL